MRIAMVGPFGLHPNKTMSSRASGFARALVKRGHKVRLFMPPWHTPEEGDKAWEEGGIGFRYVPLSGGVMAITRRLLNETLAWHPDIVHCFKPKAYSGLVAWWLWHFHRKEVRLFVDSDDWEGWGGWNDRAPYSPLQKHFFSWQERWGMSHCHQLTVASKALQSIAWSHGIGREITLYLPNGSGLPADNRPDHEQMMERRRLLGVESRPVLLLYSRFFEFESSRLVKVLAAVHAAVPDLAILFVGASLFQAQADQLKSEMAELSLLQAVIDLGWVEPGELPLLLSSADVALYLMDDTLLNRTKCPVKLADLIAFGVPVVAEAVGQVPEYILDDRNGWLCSPGDSEALIQKTIFLLQNESERQRMADHARRHYQRSFSWDLLANRLCRAYGCN